jgi:hypothetical protein
MSEQTIPTWAPVCVKLLQGPMYNTDSTWNLLSVWKSDIQNYFATIGVSVVISDKDGYAFLSQKDDETLDTEGIDVPPSDRSEETVCVPRLVKKYPLSVEESLLCVLLREELDTFDASGNQSAILKMKENDIKERLSVFIKDKNDQIKYYSKLDSYLNKLVTLTFLRDLTGDKVNVPGDREFEVRRIIRAKINPEFLNQFKDKLAEKNGTVGQHNGETENE